MKRPSPPKRTGQSKSPLKSQLDLFSNSIQIHCSLPMKRKLSPTRCTFLCQKCCTRLNLDIGTSPPQLMAMEFYVSEQMPLTIAISEFLSKGGTVTKLPPSTTQPGRLNAIYSGLSLPQRERFARRRELIRQAKSLPMHPDLPQMQGDVPSRKEPDHE